LAPLAVVAVGVAFYAVLDHNLSDDGPSSSPPAAQRDASQTTKASQSKSSKKRKRKTYVVKAGDTPSAIAEKTGVPLAEIQRLNPDLDPQLLAPGTKIKLRQ
jgi:teichoic acid transport system ATP-binding protein